MKTKLNYTSPKVLLASVALLAVAAFSSCSKKDNGSGTVVAASYVTAVNAAAASNSQDFFSDSKKLNNTPLAYTEATSYVNVGAGTHTLAFKDTTDATTNSSTSLNAVAGKYYTVFYTDDKSSVVLNDDDSKPDSAKAKIRFVNMSSALTTAVDVGITDSTNVATALAYKSASAYSQVTAGTTFSVFPTGSTTVSLKIPMTVEATRVYTVFISGASLTTLTYHVLIQN